MRQTGGIGSELVHEFLHRLFLLLDGFDEFELSTATIEIVAGAMNAKIRVPT